jgi:biopolymer transport protein ExbB
MWAFYAICIVSFVAVGFAVERFLGIRQSKVLAADLAAGLRAVASRKGEFDLRHAQRLCRQYPSSAAHVVKAMLAKVGRPVPEIEKAMTESLEHEATRMFANVRVQNLAFNVAPMLGLAGTVHGMILCFYKTAHMPVWANKMDQLADGIYAALICTLAGLVVAIPAGILAHYFEGRIISLFQRVEELARLIVLPLERFEGRSRAVLTGEKQPSSTSVLSMPRNDDPDDDDDDPLPSAKSKTLEGRP